jgi:hypothetical protein
MIYDCFKKAFVAAVGVLVIGVWAPAFADSLKIADEIKLLAATSSSDTNSIDSTVKTAEKEVEYRIGRIDIQGNWLISAEKIKNAMQVKEGAVFDRDLVVKDLQAINDLGYFERESLNVVPSKRGNKIDLLFVVFEAPVLDSVSIEGSTRLMDAELNAVFEGLIGLPLSHTGVTAAVRKIQAMYVEHSGGFPNSAPVVTERITYSSLGGLADIWKAKVLSIGPKGPALKTTALNTALLRPRRYRLHLEICETKAVLLRPRMKAVTTGHFVLPGGSKVFRMWEPTVTNMFYSRTNPRILIAPRKL